MLGLACACVQTWYGKQCRLHCVGHSLSGRPSELIVPQVGVGFYMVARVHTLLTAWPNVGTQFRSGIGTSQLLAVLC